MIDILEEIKDFVVNVAKEATKKVAKFFKDCFQHTEATILLTAASIGIAKMLHKIPLTFTIPAFINKEMLIPVVAVLIVVILYKSADYRASRRLVVQPALF